MLRSRKNITASEENHNGSASKILVVVICKGKRSKCNKGSKTGAILLDSKIEHNLHLASSKLLETGCLDTELIKAKPDTKLWKRRSIYFKLGEDGLLMESIFKVLTMQHLEKALQASHFLKNGKLCQEVAVLREALNGD